MVEFFIVSSKKQGEKGNIISNSQTDEPPLIKRFVKTLKKQKNNLNKTLKKLNLPDKISKTRITFKKLSKIVISFIVIVLLFDNANYCYANQIINDDLILKKEINIIKGSKESVQSLSQEVNGLLYANISLNTKFENETQFAQKPVILDTQSRLEIEENKKLEEEKKKIEEYNNQIALNYSQRDTYIRESSSSRYIEDTVGNTNSYSYGFCTWYVASRKSIPGSWGNAGQWIYGAQASGYATGYTPQEQSIIVTAESGWGHVGIVEQVKDDSIVISEMNFIGWGIVSSREIPKSSSVIKGYIY